MGDIFFTLGPLIPSEHYLNTTAHHVHPFIITVYSSSDKLIQNKNKHLFKLVKRDPVMQLGCCFFTVYIKRTGRPQMGCGHMSGLAALGTNRSF